MVLWRKGVGLKWSGFVRLLAEGFFAVVVGCRDPRRRRQLWRGVGFAVVSGWVILLMPTLLWSTVLYCAGGWLGGFYGGSCWGKRGCILCDRDIMKYAERFSVAANRMMIFLSVDQLC